MTKEERELLKKQLKELDRIHNKMFDLLGLYEISDPRVFLVYRLSDIMTPLRQLALEPADETERLD